MAGKTPPKAPAWWRGILTKAWRGIRARLAALLGQAQPGACEDAEPEVEVAVPAEEAPVNEGRETIPEIAEEETALTEKFPPTPDPEPTQAEVPAETVAEIAAEPEVPVASAEAAPAKAAAEPVAEMAAEPEPAAVVEPEVAEPEPEEPAVEEPVAEVAPALEIAEPAVVESIAEEAQEGSAIEVTQEPEFVAETAAAEPISNAAPVVEEVDAVAETVHEEPAAEPEIETAEPEPEREPVVARSEPVAAEAAPEPIAEEPAPAAAAEPEAKPTPEPIKREDGPDTSPVSVIVSQVYEGPFDLLLDLIRKQDIDIYDIPIAKITAQFLAYVDQLKAADMDVAGEFIYTASLLIHIKSKMLLPRAPAGPNEEAEDPRRELVERLLEHERFKNAAQMLSQKQMLEAATWTNPGMREFRHDAAAEPEIAADTVDLVRVFREILDRARNRPVINVEEDSVTVGQMIQFVARRLTMEDKPVALRRLLSHTRSERALIAMFLALLELVRLQAILLRQDRHFSEIFIKKSEGFETVMNTALANARDDWQ